MDTQAIGQSPDVNPISCSPKTPKLRFKSLPLKVGVFLSLFLIQIIALLCIRLLLAQKMISSGFILELLPELTLGIHVFVGGSVWLGLAISEFLITSNVLNH